MHVLPRVRELEERFADSLTVIGVHAGKYSTERKTDRIADACRRLGVKHAVVNDRQFRIWKEYAISAWPTVALIDPEGYIVGVQPGEFPVETVGSVIESVLTQAEERGTLRRGPDPAYTALPPLPQRPLTFPTRAVAEGTRLWISDTGAGRVLECRLDQGSARAEVLAVHDGFDEPRGLAVHGNALYVADRRRHDIVRITAGTRTTVAGMGELGAWFEPTVGTYTALRSPWGVAVGPSGALAIALAGSHQLAQLDTAEGVMGLVAGAGGEDIKDGMPYAALLAQPTGLSARADGTLAFADCESSAVRLLENGRVRTLVGTGLFDFGDRDGVGDVALLQHCEDVAWHGDVLAVADTYNDRLRRVDPRTRGCTGWQGDAGEAGAFREPGGVSAAGDELLVADTGNHRIALVGPSGAIREVELS